MVSNEYKRRLRSMLKIKIDENNLVKANNSYAVRVVRYTADIVEWTKPAEKPKQSEDLLTNIEHCI